MNLKYLFGAIISAPFLPLMYVQGKRIKNSVPTLPEAQEPQGLSGNGPQQIKLVAIGESTIAGVGVATHAEGFTGSLADTLASELDASVDWRVYARSGYTAQRVTQKIIPKIEENAVDLIIVGTGGNDAFTLNTPAKFRKHVREMIGELRQKFPDTPIVFANMPPIKEFPAFTALIRFVIGNLVEIFGDELEKEVARHEKVYYYADRITIKGWSQRLGITAERDDYFSDGVHPSQLTYQAWGKDLARWIVKNVPVRLRTSPSGTAPDVPVR